MSFDSMKDCAVVVIVQMNIIHTVNALFCVMPWYYQVENGKGEKHIAMYLFSLKCFVAWMRGGGGEWVEEV